MEELLLLLFQAVLELFINIPWDCLWYGETRSNSGDSRAFWIGAWSFLIGAALGGASLLLFPDVISKQSWLRIFLLFFSPVFAGSTGYLVARSRSISRPYVVPLHHFWWSFLFTFGYVMIRFAYADKP